MTTEEVIEYLENLIKFNPCEDLVKVVGWLKQIEKDRIEEAWGKTFEKEIASDD